MSHLHVLTEHLVEPTQGSGQEGLGIRALTDLLVQWEETSGRTHTTHTVQVVVSAPKGAELRWGLRRGVAVSGKVD